MKIEDQRQEQRIEKHLCVHYCLIDMYPNKWDISITKNISAGGIKFTASNNLQTNNQAIRLKIKVPELSPRYLDLEAVVLNNQPRYNGRTTDIRAKFINLSAADKEALSILGKPLN